MKRCNNIAPTSDLRCLEAPGHKGKHRNGDWSWLPGSPKEGVRWKLNETFGHELYRSFVAFTCTGCGAVHTIERRQRFERPAVSDRDSSEAKRMAERCRQAAEEAA